MIRALLTACLLLSPLLSQGNTTPTLTDDQLEDRVKAKGHGFQLIKATADLFRREAEEKLRLIKRERASKEALNREECLRQQQLDNQDILSAVTACNGSSGALPLNMRNRLQSEMLEGGVLYVREIRRPLLGLLSSNVFSDFSEQIYSLDQIAQVWQETEVVISEDQPTRIEPGRVVINPGDRRGRIFIFNFKIMLASATLMFDSYEEVLSEYLFDEEMRKSVRYMDGRYRDVSEVLIALWERAESGATLRHLVLAVNYYDRLTAAEKRTRVAASLDTESKKMERRLDKVIRSSIAYRYAKESPEKLQQRQGLSLWWEQQGDAFRSWWRDRAHDASRFFGNLVGQDQCRKGVMYNAYHGRKMELDALAGEIRAGDILLEKTPFRATDKFIPGHYGHVAIWTGTQEELKAYGIWELLPALHRDAVRYHKYPESPTFQESVAAGGRIVEALRPGVEFHSLEHFMDIDDLGVLRPLVCLDDDPANDPNSSGCNTHTEIRRALINSFQQLGKTYDFAFDAFTKDKIVCSELAYQAYDHVEFEVTPSLGTMASISPDQVAFKADGLNQSPGSQDPFRPVILFHNGTRISGEQPFLDQVFSKLLEASDKSYSWVYEHTPAEALPRCF